MTPEKKAEALAALDAYAEVFGPRLAPRWVWDDEHDCACFAGALTLFVPVNEHDPTIQWARVLDELEIPHVAVVVNDEFRGTPEQRFQHMRQWLQRQ